MNVTDYVKSSTNSACTSVKEYGAPWLGGNTSCYNNSNTHNYLILNNSPWTVSPAAGSDANGVFVIFDDGYLAGCQVWFCRGANPTFFLSSETTLNGEGSEADPYTVSKYVEEVKEEPKVEKNNRDEVKVDDTQLVEVPSTSAFGSLIIAGLGIACVTGSAVIMRRTTRK